MARVDDYRQAFELGQKELTEKDPDLITGFSGAVSHRDKEGKLFFSLNFLNKEIIISWPGLEFSYKRSNEEPPIQQQVLILHYLSGALSSKEVSVKGEWISYQEIPDGKFYLGAFLKRAKNPMVQAFGNRPEMLVKLAMSAYQASPFDHGDFSVRFQALPMVPVALILWKGDDEFQPEGNFLFDRSISGILSAEDTAWLAGMIVYPLIGMASKASPP